MPIPTSAQLAGRRKWIEENSELAQRLGMTGAGRQLTDADVAIMSGAELSKAAKAGLMQDYFSTPNNPPRTQESTQ